MRVSHDFDIPSHEWSVHEFFCLPSSRIKITYAGRDGKHGTREQDLRVMSSSLLLTGTVFRDLETSINVLSIRH
jgi:hypothetical protein